MKNKWARSIAWNCYPLLRSSDKIVRRLAILEWEHVAYGIFLLITFAVGISLLVIGPPLFYDWDEQGQPLQTLTGVVQSIAVIPGNSTRRLSTGGMTVTVGTHNRAGMFGSQRTFHVNERALAKCIIGKSGGLYINDLKPIPTSH